MPGDARGKDKTCEKTAYNTPRPPMSVHKLNQPNRSSRLAGYTQHMHVLFYYIDRLSP